MASSAVIASHLSKRFGHGGHQITAVDDISLRVEKGEMFGIIGPDGAGKTTLFRLLTSLMLPDEGQVRIEGFNTLKQYKEIRRIIGYMPGRFSLYQDLSVEENLNFFATLFGTHIRANYDFIYPIYRYLEPFKKRKAGNLSGGMKQKLALCCALIHNPKVLFLDEPTTGVDPVSRKEFWEMLGLLQQKDITVVASTPYMSEAMRCHRIGFIQNGKIIGCDTPQNIREAFPWLVLSVRSAEMFRLLQDLRAYPNCRACHSFGAYQHIYLPKGSDPEDLHRYLTRKRHNDIRIKETDATIEDCFMDLMAKKGESDGH